MSSIINDSAMESMFDAEQTTATLLEAVKANVAKTVKTVDAASALENKLSEEAAQFNACLTTMSNSIRKCERGEISREEMLAECAPCVSTLKEKCSALKLADVKTTGDDITEDEIAMLKEYIVGCKDIVADRKKELQDCPVEDGCATEGVLAALSEYEPATEAKITREIRKSTEAKTAAQLYKQAKKLYGLGSKDQALTYLKKAQKLYEGCLKKAEEAGKMYEVEREVKVSGTKDTFKKEVTDSISAAVLIKYYEDRIDACKALEMQWNNKAGKSTYAETKAQLKEERKAARAAKKEAKKAAAAEESTLEVEADSYADAAIESMIDDAVLDYDLMVATEGQNLEARKIKKQYGKEMRLLAKEGKKLYKVGKYAESKAKYMEAAKLADEIASEVSNLDPSAGSAILGTFVHNLKIAGLALLSGVTVVGLPNAFILSVKEAIKDIGQLIDILNKAGKGELSASDFNTYVVRIKQYAKQMGDKYRKLAQKSAKFNGESEEGKDEAAEEAFGMSLESFIEAMESEMDAIELEISIDAATEAEGEEAEAPKATGIFGRLRGGLANLRDKNSKKDRKAVAEDVKEAAKELEAAADEASTPEEKKRLKKAAKGALVALGTTAAAVGLYAVAKKCKQKSESSGQDPKAVAKLIYSAVDSIERAGNKLGDKIGDGVDTVKGKIAVAKTKQMIKKGKPLQLPGSVEEPAPESFLEALAFGLESVIVDGEDVDDDKVEPMEGKAFDDEDLIEEANESELDELATEAAIAVMMAEDGLDDSDLD